jgi:hypothetical protein
METIEQVKEYIKDNKKTISYMNLVYNLAEKFGDFFRGDSLLLDKSDIELIKFTPLMFSSNPTEVLSRKKKLTSFITEQVDDFCGEDRLTCIGSGNIDANGIVIIGMTAGFRFANKYDEVSFPFKWSFYFGEASEILRRGFLSKLPNLYFTNVGKFSYSRPIMNSPGKYTEVYETCFPVLEMELDELKPRRIFSLGYDVYSFLKSKHVESTQLLHPAYFLFKHTKDAGIVYYKNVCGSIR